MIVNRFERYEQIRINHADITRKKKKVYDNLPELHLHRAEKGRNGTAQSNPQQSRPGRDIT